METKILADLQICISVPLNRFVIQHGQPYVYKMSLHLKGGFKELTQLFRGLTGIPIIHPFQVNVR